MSSQLVFKVIEFELLCSMTDAQQIANWADEQIISSDEPEEILFDLCLTTSKEKQLKILGCLNANLENEAFALVAIKLLKRYELGLLDFFEVANKLVAIHYHSSNLSVDFTNFIIWLDDEACLITEGIKELETAEDDLIRFLLGIKEKHSKRLEFQDAFPNRNLAC